VPERKFSEGLSEIVMLIGVYVFATRLERDDRDDVSAWLPER
jgi:hypothetical protein